MYGYKQIAKLEYQLHFSKIKHPFISYKTYEKDAHVNTGKAAASFFNIGNL